jgi:phosphoribosylanthranilate isomerase
MEARNMTVRVKVCGITRAEDAHTATLSGADALGFVFHRPSPRYVAPEKAAAIIRTLPPFTMAVGIFVNLDKEEVERIVVRSGIHAIQLHGNELPEECTGFTRPVIKAFRFSYEAPLPDLSEYRVAGLLVDSGSYGSWGGTGIPFDWENFNGYLNGCTENIRHRLVVAGGLNAQNVGHAVRILRPYAVDVSSGVESEPGKKSEEKIKEFMHAVRKAGFTQDVA